MKIRAGSGGLFLSLLISALGGTQVQEVPAATEYHGGFGLPDARGNRLLLIPDLPRPERLTTALCGGGRRVPVRFERRQVERTNNGRQRSSNFDVLAGSIFTVVGDRLDTDAPCFLAAEAALTGSTVLSIAVPEGPSACLQPVRFATPRDRAVIHCWPIARLASEEEVVLLEFERRGTDALASLALVHGERTIFADMPAEFRAAGQDLWRVDDGGELSPDGIQVVCALQRDQWYALGIVWTGAEGRLLSLWVADSGDRFTKVLSDYWYQAPGDS